MALIIFLVNSPAVCITVIVAPIAGYFFFIASTPSTNQVFKSFSAIFSDISCNLVNTGPITGEFSIDDITRLGSCARYDLGESVNLVHSSLMKSNPLCSFLTTEPIKGADSSLVTIAEPISAKNALGPFSFSSDHLPLKKPIIPLPTFISIGDRASNPRVIKPFLAKVLAHCTAWSFAIIMWVFTFSPISLMELVRRSLIESSLRLC